MTDTEGFGMIPVHLVLLLVKTNHPQLTNADQNHLPETACAATKWFMCNPQETPTTTNELLIQPELRCIKAAGNGVYRALFERTKAIWVQSHMLKQLLSVVIRRVPEGGAAQLW